MPRCSAQTLVNLQTVPAETAFTDNMPSRPPPSYSDQYHIPSSKTLISRSLHKIMGAPWIAANIRAEKQVMLGKRKFCEHQNVFQNNLNTLREILSVHALTAA